MNHSVTETSSGTDVSANSSSASQAASAPEPYDYIGEDGNVIEPSQASAQVDGKNPAESATAPDAKKEAEEAEAKAKNKQALTPGLKKRIDGLTAEKREAQKQILQLQSEVERWKAAYELREGIAKQKESRLSELEPEDPLVVENERLKLEQTLRMKQAELEQAYQKRVKEAESKAQTKALVDRWSEEVEEALAQYPDVSNAELVLTFKSEFAKNPKVKIADIAKQIDDRRFTGYEARVIAKYGKDRLMPPQPTAQNGHIAPPKGNTDDDLIAYLDATLGDDWGRSRKNR
jgi:hypothetical protein